MDVDSIPIIDLQIDHTQTTSAAQQSDPEQQRAARKKKKPLRKFVIAADETVADGSDDTPGAHHDGKSASTSTIATPQRHRSMSPLPGSTRGPSQTHTRPGRSLLTFDSSTLGQLSLEGGQADSESEILRREAEELEMTLALREVEKKRLEMQRELERGQTVLGEGVDADGTVVKRKKKKKTTMTTRRTESVPVDQAVPDTRWEGGAGDMNYDDNGNGDGDGMGGGEGSTSAVVKKKKKKKKRTVKPVEEGASTTPSLWILEMLARSFYEEIEIVS